MVNISNPLMQFIANALIVLIFTTSTVAAQSKDIIELPAEMGKINFNHKKHQEMLKDCNICHANGTGKISELGMEWGHRTCRQCHIDMKTGLINCTDCHKK